jgi:hypothetical protein
MGAIVQDLSNLCWQVLDLRLPGGGGHSHPHRERGHDALMYEGDIDTCQEMEVALAS